MQNDPALDQLCINTIRTLSMDAVQKANSGHPGTPMALAPVAYHLWQNHLRYDPDEPLWPNRDRFVLSVGHASMLLYSLLHLANVKAVDEDGKPTGQPAVSLEDIERFRQIDSKTPGHPEYRMTTGVETTTGPLGQGLGNSVGMAMAARWYENRFNKPDAPLFDYRVYALCGDGDMMEGISHEAASLAGHLKLSNLIWIYDSNRVTIEGHTDLAYSDDVESRFRGYNWHTLHVNDANDAAALEAALVEAKSITDRPTLIVVNSIIGWGAPNKQDTASAHGEALGVQEVALAKKFYGWPEDKFFYVPDGVHERFAAGIGARGKAAREEWQAKYDAYGKQYPELSREFALIEAHELPVGWDNDIPTFDADPKGIATRESSGKVLNAIAARVPWMIGGAADLAPSTKTNLKFEGAGSFEHDNYGGRNLHFGIREHGMGAVVNGLALSNLRPFGSTFLIFSDYMKPPIRLSAIMEVEAIYIFTHDSIGVGEDRATRLAAWRARPHRAASGRCKRSGRSMARRADAKAPSCVHRRIAAGAAYAGPQPLCIRRGREEGRLCARRCTRRTGAASHSDGHRQRAFAMRRHLREAEGRGHCGARRVDAFMGSVRTAGRGVSGCGSATGHRRARGSRAGRDARLGPLCRPARRAGRDAHVRRIGAACGSEEEVRLHARACL
jgi:transketolase